MSDEIVKVLLGEMAPAVRWRIAEAVRGDLQIAISGQVEAKDDIVALIRRLRPNLVLIGVGAVANEAFETTQFIMAEAPTPIVLIADHRRGADVEASALALRSGALAVLPLPEGGETERDEEARRRFRSSLKAMAEVKLVRRWRDKAAPAEASPPAAAVSSGRLIAIAASTGGPAALQQVLSDLPPDFTIPILVVQHIAQGFADGLAEWLNTVCALTVKIAAHGEPLRPRTAYLAPDGRHLGVSSRSTIILSNAPPIDGFRPAADYLFESAAREFGSGLTVVMLTGMGQDGVAGLRTVRRLGGEVIAQDEVSSVVYGMPKAAFDAGLVNDVLPLSSIAPRLIEMVDGAGHGRGG